MKEEEINKKFVSATLNDLRLLYKIFDSIKADILETSESIFKGIGILDVFNYCLSENEASKYLWIDDFGQKHVCKSLNFISDAFRLNHCEPVFVKIDKFWNEFDKNSVINRVLTVDEPKDRTIFLNILLNDEYFLKVNI